MKLVLSLFPGVGLLDRAFEEEGFTIVRGPDLIFGGDVRRFCPPRGVFAGVLGGPPCPDFSTARREEVKLDGYGVEMLGEFARIVDCAEPLWWIMENVPSVPDVAVPGYQVQRIDVDNGWFAEQRRLRVIQFGRAMAIDAEDGDRRPQLEPWMIEWIRQPGCWDVVPEDVQNRPDINFERDVDQLVASVVEAGTSSRRSVNSRAEKIAPELRPAVSLRSLKREPAAVSPVGLPLDIPRGEVSHDAEPAVLGSGGDTRSFRERCRLQGLPDEYELPFFTEKARCQAVGNGVPLPMGRTIARAVLASIYGESGAATPLPEPAAANRCSECDRPISGRATTCSARCRKRRSLRLSEGAGTSTVTGPARAGECEAPDSAGEDARFDVAAGTSWMATDFTTTAGLLPRGEDVTTGDLVSSQSEPTSLHDAAGLLDFLNHEGGIQYPGGKGASGTWQWLVSQMPPHTWFLSLFTGSGAVERRKVPSLHTWLFELDPFVAEWWKQNLDRVCPGAQFVHGDGLRWFEEHADRLPADALTFLDPPYLLKQERDQPYNLNFTRTQHVRLLKAAETATCRVMLCGYDTELYAEGLRRPKWRRSTRLVPTRWGGLKTECLWMNYDPATESGFERTVPGKDKRDRWSLKKKARRWADNAAAMSSEELFYVTAAVLDAVRSRVTEGK